MRDILSDTSPAAMVRANEANLVEWWRVVAAAQAGGVVDDPDLFWFTTGIPIGYFNGVARADLPPDLAEERIETVKRRLRERRLPGEWWIGPSMRPADLGERLLRQGFAEAGATPGMGVDLDALRDDQPDIPGLAIERVRDAERLRAWVEVVIAGFGVEPVAETAQAVFTRMDLTDEVPLRLYLARLDGEPVACSALLLAAGVAGLYAIATLPAARGRGIGAAVTLAPLREARARGYRVAVLQASGMGYPVYQRLGFAEQARFRIYSWDGSAS